MPILSSIRPGNERLFALDTTTPVRINRWESYLKGWFVASPASLKDADMLGVFVDGLFVPAVYGFSRPDVGRHLNDATLANCGFHIRFRHPRWNPLIKVAAQSRSATVVLAELSTALEPANGDESDRTTQVDSYEGWLVHREASLFWPEKEIYDRVSALPYRPLVSVILPTYNADTFLLDQCVQSVLRQRYANWQLCISDDCSSGASIEHLKRLAAGDERISLMIGRERAGISEVQNRALQSASGDFIVTLNQNDELHPRALLELIRRLNQHNDCELIYSDEDKIDVYGARGNPAFKPDIDLDMLLTFNYIGGLMAVRRSTVLTLDGFRSMCDGAQEWDLLIRLLEKVGTGAVQHIAKPLYHRRRIAKPAVPSVSAKPCSRKASVRALSDHVERSGKQAVVEPGIFPGSLRLKHLAPQTAKVAVFIRAEDGDFQIRTLRAGASRRHGISIYQTIDCAVRRVDIAGRGGDSALLTLGEVAGEVLIFINRPLEILNHSFFEELAGQALREECGLVTGISVDSEGRALHTGLIRSISNGLIDPFVGIELSQATYLDQLSVTRSVEMVSDEFFAVRREHLASVGGLSSIASGQMPQLVQKLVKNANKHGLRVIVTPFAVASFHHASPNVQVEPTRQQDHLSVGLNPNLFAFKDFAQVAKGVF